MQFAVAACIVFTCAVVFMDEAGLPEDSHESLKALHYFLDHPQVSFVAITNRILDAAKTNRAISLFRPDPEEVSSVDCLPLEVDDVWRIHWNPKTS